MFHTSSEYGVTFPLFSLDRDRCIMSLGPFIVCIHLYIGNFRSSGLLSNFENFPDCLVILGQRRAKRFALAVIRDIL